MCGVTTPSAAVTPSDAPALPMGTCDWWPGRPRVSCAGRGSLWRGQGGERSRALSLRGAAVQCGTVGGVRLLLLFGALPCQVENCHHVGARLSAHHGARGASAGLGLAGPGRRAPPPGARPRRPGPQHHPRVAGRVYGRRLFPRRGRLRFRQGPEHRVRRLRRQI